MNIDLRRNERGNVVFYIFMAVALFGALSFAVSQSGRESGESMQLQQNKLRATEMIDYSDSLAKAVGMIRLRGTTLATLTFTSAGTGENNVFSADGGAISYQTVGSDVTTTTGELYQFLAGNAIQDVGSTCNAASCTELLMVLAHVKPNVCAAINQLGGINPPTYATPVDSGIDLSHPFVGTMEYAAKIGDETSSAVLKSQMYGCFQSSADNVNYFYRVLWQQ